MIFNLASSASALVLLGAAVVSVSAAPNNGQIAQITSGSDWCMMMPPSPGGDIAENEDRAIAFCTNANANAPGAKIFPEGFIQSAHFATGNGYVQVTGMIDRTKYSLADNDQGGQYDIRAPVGSACANYNHYVNLIEPHSNTYCIRCCKEKADCNTGKSTYGCAYIVKGDYSGSNNPAKPVVPTTGAPVASSSAVPTSGAPATASVAPTGSALPSSPATTAAASSGAPTGTATTTGAPQPTSGANSQAQSLGLVGAAAVGALAFLAL